MFTESPMTSNEYDRVRDEIKRFEASFVDDMRPLVRRLIDRCFAEQDEQQSTLEIASTPEEAKKLLRAMHSEQCLGQVALKLFDITFRESNPGYTPAYVGTPVKTDGVQISPGEIYWQEEVRTQKLVEPYGKIPAFIDYRDAIVQALLSPIHKEFEGPEQLAIRSGDYWLITPRAARKLKEHPELTALVNTLRVSSNHPISVDQQNKRREADYHLDMETLARAGIKVGVNDLPDNILVVEKPGATAEEEVQIMRKLAAELPEYEFPLELAFKAGEDGIKISPFWGSWPTEPRPFDPVKKKYGWEPLPENALTTQHKGNGITIIRHPAGIHGYRPPSKSEFEIRHVGIEKLPEMVGTHGDSFVKGNVNKEVGIDEERLIRFVEKTNMPYRKYHEFARNILDDGYMFLAALYGNKIAGMVAYDTEPRLLSVHSDLWGNGLAEELFRLSIEDIARTHNLNSGVFATTKFSKALDVFVEKLGFEITGYEFESPPWVPPHIPQVELRWSVEQ